MALRGGSAYITRSDWLFFAAALFAIPIWIFTKNPLEAVIWATLIDLVGYAPTFRKSWQNPNDEMISAFSLGCLKNGIGIIALENYTLTTLTYPVVILTADVALIVMLVWRRVTLLSKRNPL